MVSKRACVGSVAPTQGLMVGRVLDHIQLKAAVSAEVAVVLGAQCTSQHDSSPFV